MYRRTLLQLVGGIAVRGVRPFALQSGARTRIVIAGGGILGANIAYQLAKRGASVTLLEKAEPATGAAEAPALGQSACRPVSSYRRSGLALSVVDSNGRVISFQYLVPPYR